MTDLLRDRLQASLGSSYALERELGGGGMSRVFVARELALGRPVVLKLLPPELVGGVSLERFRREVRVAARLQHPHIVPLLAAGALDGGVLYYTMPFVEGESLRARLEREGALPVADVVRIVRDVASALDYAHGAGVVHRDVKPENVLLSQGGAVVADFGIAKAISAARGAEGDGDGQRSSTLTAAGSSLGTPAYMAPEQAAGDAVDHRADLYALGVVAYEMLAGRAPFEGRTAQQLLAAHAVEAPEPVARRRPAVPPALAALVMRLLEKHPADRPQTAAEVSRAVDALTDASDATTGRRGGRRLPRYAAWATGTVAALAAAALLGARLPWRSGAAEAPRRAVVSLLGAPDGQELRPEEGFALSPDGARLALVAADASGATAIWLRPLDSLGATRVDGTEGGSGPFWSPDGASLGFFARGQLQVADLRGGQRRALCPARRPGGGTWTRDGVIVFSPDFVSEPLFRVPAAGGRCTALTRLRPNDAERHRSPSALPDGRRVLFYRGYSPSGAVAAVDLATGAVTDVRPEGAGQWVPPDWIVFRDRPGGALYAQQVDGRTLRATGEPRLLIDRIGSFRSFQSFTATPRALVALRLSGAGQALTWVDRRSTVVDSVLAPPGTEAFYLAAAAAVSRDGRRVAFGGTGLWLHDRSRNVATRVRAEAVPGQGIIDPVWGPGDSVIAYGTIWRGDVALRLYHVRAGRSDSLFASGRRIVRTPDWSPDGRRLAFQLSAGDSVATDEIWIYDMARRRAERAWESPTNLANPRWSPDGRWLAYVSDESGAPEVYVRPVSGAGVAARVSTAGGQLPRWRADGRELYYRAPNGAIMAVQVALGATPALSPPRVAVADPRFSRTMRGLDVTPDGERFVAFGRGNPPVLTLVVDWAARVEPP